VAVNGCLASTVVDSDQPLLLAQQRLNSSCDDGTCMVVGYDEQSNVADTDVVEPYITDGIRSNNEDQEYLSSTSSCAPLEVLIMNGAAGNDVSDVLNIPDVETDDVQSRLSENSDGSTHISAVDKLVEDTSSLDKMHSFSVCTDASLLDSSAVAQADNNAVAVALSSGLLSQAGGISAADMSKSLRDCQAVHEQLGVGSECMSAASLDAASMPRLRHDRHSVSSISSDTCASSINLGARTGSDILPNIVSISQSSEKLWSWPNRRERAGFDSQAVGVVRSSWSQENYFDDSDVTCVDIDLDDDDLASSVDVLHYRDTALPGDTQPYWTEHDIRHTDSVSTGKLRSWAPLKGDEVFAELFSSGSESSLDDDDYSSTYTQSTASDFRKAAKTYGVGVAIDFDPSEDSSSTVISLSSATNSHRLTNWNSPDSPASSSDNFDDLSDDSVNFSPSVFSEIATRPSSKDVDRPSAARLAKRLYYLQGFRKSDISRHLTKKYDVCTH